MAILQLASACPWGGVGRLGQAGNRAKGKKISFIAQGRWESRRKIEERIERWVGLAVQEFPCKRVRIAVKQGGRETGVGGDADYF